MHHMLLTCCLYADRAAAVMTTDMLTTMLFMDELSRCHVQEASGILHGMACQCTQCPGATGHGSMQSYSEQVISAAPWSSASYSGRHRSQQSAQLGAQPLT